MNEVVVDITRCSRCGGAHEKVEFKPLARAGQEWSHWAMCPIAQQPVWMNIHMSNKPDLEPAFLCGDGESSGPVAGQENYPAGWLHAVLHVNPLTGEMHSDGDHALRWWIQARMARAEGRAVDPDGLPAGLGKGTQNPLKGMPVALGKGVQEVLEPDAVLENAVEACRSEDRLAEALRSADEKIGPQTSNTGRMGAFKRLADQTAEIFAQAKESVASADGKLPDRIPLPEEMTPGIRIRIVADPNAVVYNGDGYDGRQGKVVRRIPERDIIAVELERTLPEHGEPDYTDNIWVNCRHLRRI